MHLYDHTSTLESVCFSLSSSRLAQRLEAFSLAPVGTTPVST
jgi:hypothetical protein